MRRHLVLTVELLLTIFLTSANLFAADQDEDPPKPSAVFELPVLPEAAVQSLVDLVSTQLTYQDGYTETGNPAIEANLKDLTDLRIFQKQAVDGALVIGIRKGPAGRYFIIKATATDEQAGLSEQLVLDADSAIEAASSKIAALKNDAFKDILSHAAFSYYPLSYIKVDRALGALKTMGYNVIELKEAQGLNNAKVYDLKNFDKIELPIITTIADSENTSLVEERPNRGAMGSVTPSLGGRSLTEITDSSAQQRLLIAYDSDDPGLYQKLLQDIQEIVDVPAQQILIEGMIVEVSEDKTRELGIDFTANNHRMSYSHSEGNTTISYSDFAPVPEGFEANLRAMVQEGNAEVLSKPSILALNNYQARIRIGREIPISTSVVTAASTKVDINYFFMGIVLNIKPRVSRDQKEVSMQVEAIVSSKAPVDGLKAGEYEIAPVIDSRVVQTFARVSNNTPFIIGGLISHDLDKKVKGIPYLMEIPLLGTLFKKTTEQMRKNEVIVVLTPRVVPRDSENYFAVIPKDSDAFEFLSNSRLFRNTYRIRGEDKFDLTFVYEDPRYVMLSDLAANAVKAEPELTESPAIRSILDRNIPGETPLMLRMLYEVVQEVESKVTREEGMDKHESRIPDENIIMLQPRKSFDSDLEQIHVKRLASELEKLKANPNHALVLKFDTGAVADQSKLMVPLQVQMIETSNRSDYNDFMKLFNKMRADGTFESAAIVLQTPKDLRRLKTCLILKKLLAINNMPSILHVKDFPVGKQILYPNLSTQNGYSDSMYVIDAKVAELYYISDFYYQVFQQIYRHKLDQVESILRESVLEEVQQQ